ncbi:restriction endonuclease subunit S [Helicobacter pullorum]|uniref:restriction endonuclease subunit S n=1 Tax=Helicobacter pullorum TaxID=35818 RepID=UPI0008169BDA|nr:restriction endonuclease subunit S [Helicobacter pullorum]OCR13804.1 restriction endonuclease subunit S [Helicobacter pullorum]
MRAYKDSGIEWLGEIPEHWEVVKGSFLFFNKKELNSNFQCKTRLALTLNGVIEKDIEQNFGLNPLDFRTYQIFNYDDLVFKLIDLDNINTSRVGYVYKEGIMSSAYIRLTPNKKSYSKYFYYYYYSLYVKRVFNNIGTGVRSTLNVDELLSIKIPLPPIEEQKAIADFLDSKCKLIETFIEKKQKLITLLNEKKQALINECVTKGLDKNVNFKDSGIEHLGAIPTHWEIKKLKMLFSFGNGLNITKADFVSYGVPCVSYGEIHSKYSCRLDLSIHTLPFVSETYLADKPQSLLQKGDFVFADTSEDIEGSGNFTSIQSDMPIFAGYHTITLKPKANRIHSPYFSFLFDSNFTRNQIRKEVCGVKVFSITKAILKEIQCIIPPLQEQKQIAEFLDSEISKIDSIIEKIKKQIELIKEYKSTLINQAVCGRINL